MKAFSNHGSVYVRFALLYTTGRYPEIGCFNLFKTNANKIL